jgi:hypothetical protein
MKMIGNKSPGKTGSGGVAQDGPEPINEIILIMIVAKDTLPFYSPTNDVVQSAGCVYACFTWHNNSSVLVIPERNL